MIYQNQDGMPDDIAHFACYFGALANQVPGIDQQQFITFWRMAIDKGIIDGNQLDSTYLEIMYPQSLCNIMGLPFKYRDGHWPIDTYFDPSATYVVGKWFNPITNFTHFVGMDGLGTDKTHVICDTIQYGSVTVRQGHLVEYRLYDKT